MRIGSAWTKNSNDGKTYISVALDETFLELFPQIKDCNISLSHIPAESRSSENSPSWSLSLTKRKPKTDEAKPEAKEETSVVGDDEIPF